ncbi:MerR family transcriptional regulator [Streptomyces sp. NP160]|uniref:MerR family transcriptional regulator n=1 Tax=Streptomyces sp. NP160 TaxID=2586637 RepID=UPI001C59C61B|nr:MerR family transcriptional regulator [Streptomyces sp. NP160]
MSTPAPSAPSAGDDATATPPTGVPASGPVAGLMTVGEMAERVALSHRTVRYYDDEGLLPARRSPGNYRLYGEDALAKMLTIRRLKPLGFTLDEMREVLALLDAVSAPAAADGADGEERAEQLERLTALEADVRRRRDKLVEQLAGADDLLASLRPLLP